MRSEALRNIHTMRQIKTSLDIARCQKVRNTNSLSKTAEEIEYLESIEFPQLNQILAKERKRIATFNASIRKSQQQVLKVRERLAGIINKNRALMKLRHELQRAHSGDNSPLSKSKTKSNPQTVRFHEVELKY